VSIRRCRTWTLRVDIQLSLTQFDPKLLSYSRSVAIHLFSSSREMDTPGFVVQNASVETPTELKSEESLLFLGYIKEVAVQLWLFWTTMGKYNQEIFSFWRLSSYKVKHRNQPDFHDDDDEAWRACLQKYGLNQRFIEGIMNSDFKNVRLTASAKFWVLLFLILNYRTLEDMEAAKNMPAHGGSPQHSGSEDHNSNHQGSTLSGKQSRVHPNYWKATQVLRQGYTTLWKAADESRLRYCSVKDKEHIVLDDLYSNSLRDFSNYRYTKVYTSASSLGSQNGVRNISDEMLMATHRFVSSESIFQTTSLRTST
jgi:hypothetical protein